MNTEELNQLVDRIYSTTMLQDELYEAITNAISDANKAAIEWCSNRDNALNNQK